MLHVRRGRPIARRSLKLISLITSVLYAILCTRSCGALTLPSKTILSHPLCKWHPSPPAFQKHEKSSSEPSKCLTGGGGSTKLALFPSIPWIEASDTWGNWAALTGTATISQVLGKATRIGRLLGPPVTAMALTFGLASVGIINPGGTAAAKSLQLLSLQLATPLILLGADLRDCVNRCGPLLMSFVVASLATVFACLFGWLFTGKLLQGALGKRDGLAIAAALMAKNIGGGINYVSLT